MGESELELWADRDLIAREFYLAKVRRGEMSMRQAQAFARISREREGLTASQAGQAIRLAIKRRRRAERQSNFPNRGGVMSG